VRLWLARNRKNIRLRIKDSLSPLLYQMSFIVGLGEGVLQLGIGGL
jgi:hypothetical protein